MCAPGVNPKRMKEFVVRMLYCEMLGHVADFGYIRAVELTAATKTEHKRVGYLAASLCFNPEHDFRFMLVSQLQRDMQSPNYLEVGVALCAMCKLLTPTMVPALLPQTIELLKHENVDISIDLIDLMHDLFDPEMLDEAMEQANVLIEALLAEDFLPLLIDNLSRLDEASDEQAEGVHNVLGIVEHLIELKPALADVIVAQTNLLKWLLKRVAARAKTFHPNRLYASEILSMLLQTSVPNQQALAADGLGGVDSLLVAAASHGAHRGQRQEGRKHRRRNLHSSSSSPTLDTAVERPIRT